MAIVMEDWGLMTERQFNAAKPVVQTSHFASSVRNVNLEFNELPNPGDNADEEDETDVSDVEKMLTKEITRCQLLETRLDELQNRNPVLRSVKSFEELNIPKNLLRGVYSLGFNAPSKIQEMTLPTLMANPPVNMIAQSQSGTGKTAAFLLASLSRVDTALHYPQVLILSPTYELAIQTGGVAQDMAKYCPDILFRYAVREETFPRGQSIQEHVVIGTPGKVFDWGRRLRFFDLKKIRVFVLDEADKMISTQGFQDQCIRIHKELPQKEDGGYKQCQMMLFSATYTLEVLEFAEQIIPDPIIIRLRREEEILDNVRQFYIVCGTPNDKYDALLNIYGALSIGQTIIFCRTKLTASWLTSKLLQDGHSVGYLSGDLTVGERGDVIKRFRKGKEKVLITTNVLSRGIDVEQVTVVINFDLPVLLDGHADCETYLHRIGRSGRFGKTGFAVNFVSTPKDVKVLGEIVLHFGKPIMSVDADSMESLEEWSNVPSNSV